MNKMKTKTLSSILSSSLIALTASISAEPSYDAAPSAPVAEWIEIGSRPATFEEQECTGFQGRENIDEGFQRQNLRQAFSSHQNTAFSRAGYGSAFSNHWLNTVSAYGDTIEIEDGSWWKIASGDSHTTQYWRPGDILIVTPNRGWFSSYYYCITNKNNGSSVRANLNVGPLAFGPNTHWINSVDQVTGHVFLDNGTCWCISNKDAYIFRNWAPNDTIIVGLNDSWFSSYDHILINVNMNTYVRAKQY